MYACMHVCIYVCMYVCMYMYVYVYAYIYIFLFQLFDLSRQVCGTPLYYFFSFSASFIFFSFSKLFFSSLGLLRLAHPPRTLVFSERAPCVACVRCSVYLLY